MADVLIRMEQYEQIAPVMKALGFSEGNEIDYHIEWTSDSLCVELHKYPISPKCEEWYAYFQSGWKYAQVKEGTRYAMDDEHTFAFLLTHFAKHYSRAGIGCRHMVDLWVYLRNHPAMDQTYLRSVLKKLRLWEFYQNICRLLAVWFEEEEPDERGEFMTQVIFSNGSWGSSLNAALNDGVRDMGKSGSALHSRIKYLTRRLFPGVMYFKNRYPVLDRHPWLLPVMWCVRLIEKLMSRSVLRKHSRQLSLLKKDELERRKKMLEYVGLDGDEEQ